MKNLFLLPTSLPSVLILRQDGKLFFTGYGGQLGKVHGLIKDVPKNLYITNDEEIKERDYGLDTFHKEVRKFRNKNFQTKYDKKIIITTDTKLIADGVQAIDDEFLEWFVKNPSCEWVEIKMENYYASGALQPNLWEYKIIIPQEEPKQETTLEQIDQTNPVTKGSTALVFKQETLEDCDNIEFTTLIEEAKKLWEESHPNPIEMALFGAKWQDKQDKKKYSEEEVLELLRKAHFVEKNIEEWFNQYKKK
jgi:hypothetical protein